MWLTPRGTRSVSWRPSTSTPIAVFLLLVIVAMVLGIVGVAAKGLLYLLFIGIAVFLAALIFAALRMRRRPGRRPAR
jgi:heme A synthase